MPLGQAVGVMKGPRLRNLSTGLAAGRLELPGQGACLSVSVCL